MLDLTRIRRAPWSVRHGNALHIVRMRSGALCAAISISGAATAQSVPCRYEIVDVIQAPPCGITGPPATAAVAISPNGRYLAGWYAQCTTSSNEAFIYDRITKEFRTLPRPPGVSSARANDVNDAGLAVGAYEKTGVGLRGFVYDIQAHAYLAELEPLPGGAWCEASAINSKNQVVGFRSLGTSVNPFGAFLYHDGKFMDIGVLSGPNSSAMDISDDGTVVGWTGTNVVGVNTRAFVWRNGRASVLAQVPNGLNSYAVACASADAVLVRGRMANGVRSFVYSDGMFLEIDIPMGFDSTVAHDINQVGTIVGRASQLEDNVDVALVWQAGLMRDLDTLVEPNEPFTIDSAGAITPTGLIVAGTNDPKSGSRIGVILDPVVVVGDAYPDCTVNVSDLIRVILDWGENETPADLTNDGIVDVFDLILVIDNWTFK